MHLVIPIFGFDSLVDSVIPKFSFDHLLILAEISYHRDIHYSNRNSNELKYDTIIGFAVVRK